MATIKYTLLFLEILPPRGGQQFIFSIHSTNQPPLEVAAENMEVLWKTCFDIYMLVGHWPRVVWCVVLWYGVLCCVVLWYGMAWHGMI